MRAVAAVLAVLLSGSGVSAEPEGGPVESSRFVVETVADGLASPWSVAILPHGVRLVTERGGRLLAIAPDGRRSEIAADKLPPIHHGAASGLMDVVTDPDFATTSRLFLSMTYGEPRANGARLVSARLAAGRLEEVKILFDAAPKATGGNHGSRLAFLPDRTLVMTLGDGGQREEAQNPASTLGKTVRLDRDGRPPADNPFIGQDGAAHEIFTLGHRNAQGIAIDPEDGAILLSEHGPRGGDEINELKPGGNYGWPLATGGRDYFFMRVTPFRRLDGYEDPLVEWTPSIAPAGLAVYRGDEFPDWRGDLLAPALKERSLRRVIRKDGRVVGQETLLLERRDRIRDVKVAPDGSVYVLTDGENAVLLRLVAAQE